MVLDHTVQKCASFSQHSIAQLPKTPPPIEKIYCKSASLPACLIGRCCSCFGRGLYLLLCSLAGGFCFVIFVCIEGLLALIDPIVLLVAAAAAAGGVGVGVVLVAAVVVMVALNTRIPIYLLMLLL